MEGFDDNDYAILEEEHVKTARIRRIDQDCVNIEVCEMKDANIKYKNKLVEFYNDNLINKSCKLTVDQIQEEMFNTTLVKSKPMGTQRNILEILKSK